MKKLLISEKQKKYLKKAIAAQDQVGGKVNAGIMDAVVGGMMCEEMDNGTIELYHGVTFDKLEHNLESGGFSPRVCSEGGPKAIWMSEKMYGYPFIFKFDMPRNEVEQLSNVDYIYSKPMTFNDFNCQLVKASFLVHYEGFVVNVDLLNQELLDRQFNMLQNLPEVISEMFEKYPLVYQNYVKPAIDSVKIKLNESTSYDPNENVWYRGYDGTFGSERGYEDLMWLTDDFEYAKSYAEEVPKRIPGHVGVVKEYRLNFALCNGSVFDLPEDVDYYDGPSEETQKELLEQGINSYCFYANNDSSFCMCLWGPLPSIGEPKIVFRTDELSENVDTPEYEIGLEKGGFQPDAHIVSETSDVFGTETYKRSHAITFVTLADNPKVYSTDEHGITHEFFLRQLMSEGVIDYFYIGSGRLSPAINRLMTGRYWVDADTISFWETPSSKGKREYLRNTVEQLGLDKETLDVDFWDTRRNLGIMSSFVLPYKWFFNGTLDDLLEAGAYSITKGSYGLYNVIIDFKRYILDRDGNIVNNNVNEGKKKKKVIKNDEGDVVPEKCDKCGGKVVLQIHGEPVYVCKDCGKYFGTMPFPKNLNENREWCEEFDYAPYCKSIANFLEDNGIKTKPFPRVVLHNQEQEGLYIKTGYYDPDTREVHIFIKDRHPKDILRSLTHEYIHHSQNLRGDLVGYQGDKIRGDDVLEKLESEAYLKGNIYFRRWTEELHPNIPATRHKINKNAGLLNESIQDIYNLAEDGDYGQVNSLLSDFFHDKAHGVTKKQWRTIPAEQYHNLLQRYMGDPIGARIPESVVYDWFENIVVPNAFAIEQITELAGHTQWFPSDEVNDEFETWRPGKYDIHDYESGYNALETEGFYEWCSLPDGSDGWSDYGIDPIFNELAQYQPNMSAGDLLVLINRVLHIGHCRGDLASAFIEGGSKSCSNISGIVRENREYSQSFWNWFGDSKVIDKDGNPLPMYHGTNSDFTAFSKKHFTHGSTAYLGIGFNFASSDSTAMQYGDKVHEVYLRALHPLTNREKTITFENVVNLLRMVDTDENPDCSVCTNTLGERIVNLSYSTIYKVAKLIYEYAENDGDIYTSFSLAYCGDNNEKIPEAFKTLGFDSSIEYDKYSDRISFVVVFEPNQIKSVNAINFNNDSEEFIDENFDIAEITEPDDVDLSSFELNDELNPRFWKDGKIDSRIRIALLDIADDFLETLDVSWVQPKDIIMTGSLANYNWSKKYSDIDLHIVMDFQDVDENMALVKDYFDSKRRIWNQEHGNITIAGFPVELYVQDIDEPHASSGVYSLERNKWLVTPDVNKFDLDYDEGEVKHKVSEYMNEIDDLSDEYEDSVADCDLGDIHERAVELFKRIKNERKQGFDQGGGEYNVGNLVFKSLRRNGYIEKLDKIKDDSYDKEKSLDQ